MLRIAFSKLNTDLSGTNEVKPNLASLRLYEILWKGILSDIGMGRWSWVHKGSLWDDDTTDYWETNGLPTTRHFSNIYNVYNLCIAIYALLQPRARPNIKVI